MPTIRDVAKASGVSVSTVSRYLNNHPDLNEETRRRIAKAIEEMDYVPSTAARNVSRLSTRTIGLTIPDIRDSFFADNASGIEDVMRQNGYSLVYGNINRSLDRLLEFIRYARQMRFDGLIITPDQWNDELLDQLSRLRIPVVALRRKPPAGFHIPYVDTDNYSGATQMLHHLYDLGHRRISHIVLNTETGAEHLRAYEDTMQSLGLEPLVVSVPEMSANRVSDGIANGREAMRRLWQAHPETTAVFASSDPLALGAMEYLAQQGVRVPEDISICGRGDLDFAPLQWFRLTSISVDRYELGCKAAQMLLKMIGKEEPEPILVEPHLVVRESTQHVRPTIK